MIEPIESDKRVMFKLDLPFVALAGFLTAARATLVMNVPRGPLNGMFEKHECFGRSASNPKPSKT